MIPVEEVVRAQGLVLKDMAATIDALANVVELLARMQGADVRLPRAPKPGAIDTDAVMRAVIAAPIGAGRIHYPECPANRDTTFGPCACSMRSAEWARRAQGASDEPA